ncbi:cytochrome C biogenesis protein [Helicobacter sp. MIT 05-5293]|uniref:cytochrome c biogenesis protein CcsA n=1 Tax=Helicobacter sp. MIT 05-5293 TaxID=1548149 RepID=UPI00051CD772|nr:cytochrome c biogenesis protein CcsA [Helicobacter sp. MIT 05-5293]TLD79908.1 cytochrome C biogenesis protein [Helicobacter sp. MIT 05-5293]
MVRVLQTLFCSMKVVIVLIAIYAIACAIATFIENDYGTIAARAWVYGAFWFELLHLWLLLSLIGCFLTSKAWQRKKYASLLLHASFIVIIIGAGITRHYGFEGKMSLREGEQSHFITSLDQYIFIQALDSSKQIQDVKILTQINDKFNRHLDEKILFFDKPLILKTGEVSFDSQQMAYKLQASIDFMGQKEDFELIGGDNETPTKESVRKIIIGDYMFFIAWGADKIILPFEIKLQDFQLERYAGSHSPSSYASLVEVIDPPKETFSFLIFMNNVLDYGGYRFFQSSYHPDEQGSILSVNRDPGKIPTYIGYTMLILGVLWLLFDKNGRFMTLGRFVKNQSFLCLAFVSLLSFNTPYLHAQNTQELSQDNTAETQNLLSNPPLKDIPDLITSLKNTKEVAKEFDQILVQDFGGRIKPMHTLTNEFIHKITKKNTFKGFNPTQTFLGMIFYPQEWQQIQMIATQTPRLREILGVDPDQKYIAYIDVFTKDGQYILKNYVEEANLMNPSHRGVFEKDLLNVDERINYAFLIYTGQVLRIFPDNTTNNNQWLYPLEAISSAIAQKDLQKGKTLVNIYKQFEQGFDEGIENNQWQDAINAIKAIRHYQRSNDSSLSISQAKVDSEIFLNRYNPFHQLIYPYLLLSIILFIIVIEGILRNKPMRPLILRTFYGMLCALFILHTIALIVRWYISGHAPWSNAYESMLYIAWAAILSGVVFFRKSSLALCASSFLAGITLFVAHLGFMDPQIGNLVPVLKSYWLNIHVSVITASYGFLGLCFILGIITLLLFVLRSPKRAHIDDSILSLTAINEMSMILGLFLLTVGNFLGGIWANESWGRYWGWDSKETWALISIGVYAIILHLRFIIAHAMPFVFSVASVIGFFSVLMTYFGVNFYLSGMHSYAAGDPVPVPTFLYVMVAGIILLIILATKKHHLEMPTLKP